MLVDEELLQACFVCMELQFIQCGPEGDGGGRLFNFLHSINDIPAKGNGLMVSHVGLRFHPLQAGKEDKLDSQE